MNRAFWQEFKRWHVDKHLLHLVARADANGVKTIDVADTVLPSGWIGPDWVCYCAGVGEDIAFEKHLTDTLGAQVWAFDPTPRSITFMQRTPHDGSRLHFVPVGLWSEDTTLRFHAPANPMWVSHSVMESLGSDAYFDAPCRSIPSIMRELGHRRIDLLKMNIEGAEHVVLEAALKADVLPRVITLTYEGQGALGKVRRWSQRLRDRGYRLLGRRAWFFTYLRG